ncbi:branched-chain amino acid transport system substrate-binding protein [Rhizobiales bacterium GAS191]|nr:branched-chain amino acid transport system substrate-binding protein [Rhizobiales bacterium GAS191]
MTGSGATILALAAGLSFSLGLSGADAQDSIRTQDSIKIGVVGPNSGPYAVIGEEVRNGFDLYLSQIGGMAGNRKVEILYEDTQAKPDVGLTKVQKLVERDGVSFLGGVVSSSVAYAIRDYVVAKNVPLVVTVASADGLTQQQAAPNIFRTNSSGSQMSHPLGKWLHDSAGYKTLIMIAPNYAMGYEQTGGFARTFVEAGGKIVKTVYPPLGTPDFGPFLTSLDLGSADAIAAVFAGSDAIKFVKQYAEYGLKGQKPLVSTILLTDDLILQQQGDAALGTVVASHYSSALETPENKAFVEAYRKTYKRPPTLYSEASYVGARIICDAIVALKGDVSNIAAVTAAMRKADFAAPRGHFRIDAYNSPIHNVHVFKVEKEGGSLINKPIAEFKDVSQFWTYDPKEYMAKPTYSDLANGWVK